VTAAVDLSALVLPDRHPPTEFLADVTHAEQAGVHTMWTYDHLVWPQLRNGPWYGCVQQPRVPFTVASVGPRGLELAVMRGCPTDPTVRR
jgi:alkanesulfonate monooxygenase SsuD/methylene tetrahydromethanopterin reductase-like flavin-dependent oxidoreductase (luciferase family)